MDEITVRRGLLSDLPYVYEICLKTGDDGKDASALFFDPYTLGHYYAAPYLVYPEGICFVAEYQYRPQGYIAAAADTVTFSRWMEEQWLPSLRKHYPQPFPLSLSEKEESNVELIHECHYPIDTSDQPWLGGYPAHLHIDLLPGIQRKGIGRALMDALFSELARQDVPGVCLGVGSSNQSAIAFYQKMGFSVLQEHEWGLAMGKRYPHNTGPRSGSL